MYWQPEAPQTGDERTTYISHRSFAPIPEWLREKKLLRTYGNGLGAATLAYIAIASASTGFLMLAFASIFPNIYIRGSQFYAPEYLLQLISLSGYLLSLVVPFAVFAIIIKIPARVALPFRRCDAGMTCGGFLIGMGVVSIASLASMLLQNSLGLIGIKISMPDMPIPEEPLALGIYLFMVIALPAFLEEAVFRGVIMQSLRRFGDTFAVVMSAFIFGMFHLNLVQFPYAFILGLCLGYFTLRTGSLWCAVMIHFVNNAVAVASQYAFTVLGENPATLISNSGSVLWLLLGGFALFVLLGHDRNLFMLNNTDSPLPAGEMARVFLCSPVLLAALVVAALITTAYMTFSWFAPSPIF